MMFTMKKVRLCFLDEVQYLPDLYCFRVETRFAQSSKVRPFSFDFGDLKYIIWHILVR